jgi:GNAT superfamily N-acetyltransferase
MYTYKLVKYFGEAVLYSRFTFPLYRGWMLKNGLDDLTVAIGVESEGIPIGLAVGKIDKETKCVELLSICVDKAHRKRGIGSELAKLFELQSFLNGCRSITVSYTTDFDSENVFEYLLKKFKWQEPKVNQLICKGDTNDFNTPWLNRGYRLPPSFELFPWSEITEEEREEIIQSQKTEQWIPNDLIPFKYEAGLEPLNSLGMRYRNKVIGWLITHRLEEDTIRYTCSFVHKDVQRMGRIVPMYVEAIRRQVRFLPGSKAIWTVPIIHQGMISFVNKHMKPYLKSVKESRLASKALTYQ